MRKLLETIRAILAGRHWHGYNLLTLEELRRDSTPVKDIEDAI